MEYINGQWKINDHEISVSSYNSTSQRIIFIYKVKVYSLLLQRAPHQIPSKKKQVLWVWHMSSLTKTHRFIKTPVWWASICSRVLRVWALESGVFAARVDVIVRDGGDAWASSHFRIRYELWLWISMRDLIAHDLLEHLMIAHVCCFCFDLFICFKRPSWNPPWSFWETISHGQSPVGAIVRVESSRFSSHRLCESGSVTDCNRWH